MTERLMSYYDVAERLGMQIPFRLRVSRQGNLTKNFGVR